MHGDFLHILFNMYWFYRLGSMVEDCKGSVRLGMLILFTAAAGNLGQALMPIWTPGSPSPLDGGVNFLGYSGVVYGIFGYLWIKTSYGNDPKLFISSVLAIFFMVFMLLGFLGFWDTESSSVANWGHFFGMVSGMAFAYFFEPQRT